MTLKLGLAALVVGVSVGPVLAGGSSYTSLSGKPLPTITGDVSLGFGGTWTDTDIEYVTGSPYSPARSTGLLKGYGRVNIPLDDRWNFEFEATGQSDLGPATGNSSFGANGHLWAEFPNAALGAFGGLSAGHSLGICPFPFPFCGLSPDRDLQSATAGGEGEAYFDRLTVGGQASLSWNALDISPSAIHSADFETWQLRGYAHYYPTANDKLTAEVKYTDLGSELRFGSIAVPRQYSWQFTGRAEHRFAGTPWSIWASGSYAAVSDDGVAGVRSITQDVWTALIGFQLFTDAPGSTLQGHDRQLPFDYDNYKDLIWEWRPPA